MPDIPLWNKCDNRCAMCANGRRFARASSGRYRLKGQIARFESYLAGDRNAYAANAADARALNLTGGEPALNPDLVPALAYYRRRVKGELTLMTNGRRFADRKFAAAVLSAAKTPFTAAVALHGPTAPRHDAVTGVRGSFAETLAGLKNIAELKKPGQCLEIRVVLHARNIGGLEKTLLLARRLFARRTGWRVVALHYEAVGCAAGNGSLGLTLEDSAAAVNGLSDIIRRFREFRLYHFPLCLLKEELRPLVWISLPPEDRVYPAVCGGCAGRRSCPGVMRAYRRAFGMPKLKAVPALRKRGKPAKAPPRAGF